MSGELGRASYELDADLEPLRRGIKESKSDVKDFERTLDLLTGVSDIAAKQLSKIRMKADQLAETKGISDSFKRELADISADAERARADLERVKLGASNVAETTAAGDAIDRKLKDVTGNANEARRALESVRLAGIGAGGAGGGGIPGGGNRNPGAGVGPFGSGFGRIGLLGTAIGGGILTTPAAGPAVLGLLAATPVLAGAAAGSLGVLALAFDGVTKAIGGDKKAFDGLGPSAQEFVQTVRSLDGWFEKLKETAAGSLFPGLAKGLKDALSPGTLNAITSAVTLLGHALGQVGEMFGRYFGSSEFTSIFGPLMQSAARTVSNLSSAALHLFDALGVLARAGIPLTDWMTRGIAAASRLADSWLHAKDATGQLGGAMNEAKTSLELVGRLVGSLFNAVGALGSALYPVSKVAVKDLTDGLNALAGIIDRNKASIQAVVSGALSALVDMVKAASKAIAVAWPLAEKLTDKLGGWKTVFEALIGLKLASVIAGWAGAFTKLAGTAALGGAEAEAGGLLTKLTSLSEFGPISIPIMLLITDKHVTGSGSKYLNDILHGGSFTGTAKDAVGFLGSVLNSVGGRLLVPFGGYSVGMGGGTGGGGSSGGKNPPTPTQRGDMRGASAAGQLSGFRGMAAQAAARYGVPVDQFLAQINQESGFNPNATSPAGALGIAQFMPGTAKGYGIDPRNPAQALPAAAKMMSQLYAKYGSWALALAAYNAGSGTVDKYLAGKGPLPAETQSYVKSILGKSVSQATYNPAAGSTSPFGTDPAFTKNLGPKPPKPPVIPNMITDLLNAASGNASKAKQAGNIGGTAKRYLENELGDLNAADAALHKLVPKSARARAQINAKETEVENKIRTVNTLVKNAAYVAGDALLPAALKTKLAALSVKFKADSTYAAVLTGKAAEAYAAILRGDITGQEQVLTDEVAGLKSKLKGASGKQKTAIQKELTKVTGQLATVHEQVVQTLQGAVQTLQQHVATQFANVQSQLMTALGKKYFQNGLLTPLEQQLADMQAADTASGLKDSLTQAQTQLASDIAAAADAATIAADGKAVEQANRAITENDLSIAAAAQRRQADADYAVKSQELTDKLADLADAFQNGTGTMADLTALAGAYGIQITTQTVPSFAALAAAVGGPHTGLIGAFGDLADYIKTLTGVSPSNTDNNTPSPSAGGSTNVFGTIDPGIAAYLGIAATASVTAASAPDALARFLKNNAVPKLDSGGYVSETGLAVVHRGETYSGVGSHRVGGETHIHIHGGTFIGGNKQQVARDLKPYLERITTLSK